MSPSSNRSPETRPKQLVAWPANLVLNPCPSRGFKKSCLKFKSFVWTQVFLESNIFQCLDPNLSPILWISHFTMPFSRFLHILYQPIYNHKWQLNEHIGFHSVFCRKSTELCLPNGSPISWFGHKPSWSWYLGRSVSTQISKQAIFV